MTRLHAQDPRRALVQVAPADPARTPLGAPADGRSRAASPGNAKCLKAADQARCRIPLEKENGIIETKISLTAMPSDMIRPVNRRGIRPPTGGWLPWVIVLAALLLSAVAAGVASYRLTSVPRPERQRARRTRMMWVTDRPYCDCTPRTAWRSSRRWSCRPWTKE